MSEIHTASSLRSAEEVGTWRGNAPLAKLPTPAGPVIQLHPYSDAEMARDPIKQVILRRGSARKFAKYRSSCDSSPPFWTGLLVASQRTSWIPRGLILTRS